MRMFLNMFHKEKSKSKLATELQDPKTSRKYILYFVKENYFGWSMETFAVLNARIEAFRGEEGPCIQYLQSLQNKPSPHSQIPILPTYLLSQKIRPSLIIPLCFNISLTLKSPGTKNSVTNATYLLPTLPGQKQALV